MLKGMDFNPASAYNGVVVSFTGVAVGEGKVFLTVGLKSGYGNVPIAVYGIASSQFLSSLPAPSRVAENSSFGAGATYLPPATAEARFRTSPIRWGTGI